MYIKKCSYADATRYADCLNYYGVPFEWLVDDVGCCYLKVKSVEPENIHSICHTFLPQQDIGWDECSSDLYVRVTKKSKEIMAELKPNALLVTFVHNIEHDKWYDLPFCKDGRLGGGMTLLGYIRK